MHNRVNWCRAGNFYQSLQYSVDADYFMTNSVDFKNTAESNVIIRKITVLFYSNGDAKITLQASPFSYKKLLLACQNLFQKNEINEWLGLDTICFMFNTSSLEKIIILFHDLPDEFPEILIQELTQLVNSLEFPHPKSFYTKKHLMSEKTVSEQHINPLRKNSHGIIKLLNEYDINYSADGLEKKLKKLLVKGEDPNQQNKLGDTPLYQAVMSIKFNPVTTLLLLCYGANPWKSRNTVLGLSPIEIARKYEKKEVYQFMMNACYQIEKRTQSSNTTKLNNVQLRPKNNMIINHFELSNSLLITTEFKKIQDLTAQDKTQLFDVYKHCYFSKDNINDAFIKAFSPEKGKVIDILRDKNHHIIGAVTSVIRKSGNDVYVFISDSFLHSDYQGCGIMPLIDYRLPFALQSLYREYNVSILYFAASYNAVRRVEKALFFPKYQPDGMKERVKDVYANVFKYSIDWHQANDGVFFNVAEENHVYVNVNRKPLTTLLEEFYYQHLKGNGEGYIPVLIPAEEDLLSTLHDMLSPRDINFYSQCQQFAEMLENSNILSQCLPSVRQGNKSMVMNSDHLFWARKNIPIDETRMIKYSVPEPKSISISKY